MKIDVLRNRLKAIYKEVGNIIDSLELADRKEALNRSKNMDEFSKDVVQYMIEQRTAMDLYAAVSEVLQSTTVNNRESFAQKLRYKIAYLKKKNKHDPCYLKKLQDDLITIAFDAPRS